MTNMIGDIVLFIPKKPNLIQRLIKLFTISVYTHAGIITTCSDTRVVVLESFPKLGVVLTTYNIEPDYQHVFTHKQITNDERIKLVDFAFEQKDGGYDFKAILYRIWLTLTFQLDKKNEWDEDNKFYCGEYISYVYDIMGLTLSTQNIHKTNLTPGDISRCKQLKRRTDYVVS